MEGILVSAAAGALQSVLEKLAALLGDKYKRFERVRKEIGFLSREREAMEAFLIKMSMEEDPDVQDKVWMKEVRELSYDMEDSIDEFMVHADKESAKPDGVMEKIRNLVGWTKWFGSKDEHKIAKEIKDFKGQIGETSKRHKRYRTGEPISKVNNVTVDRRALAIFEDASELVGIDEPKNDLIRLFSQESRCESSRQQHQPKIISIVGFGGLGKTTLAYQVHEELKGQFDCHAFVSVSRNPDIMKVLGNILNKVSGQNYSNKEDITQIISQIKSFLEKKRYFIVVDDIWNVEIWDVIKLAFPRNGYDCRILTTTRVTNVAQACCSSFNGHIFNMKGLSMVHSRQLFHRRLFNFEKCPPHLEGVSSQILEKCAGLPLAIIAVSGLLANKAKTVAEWDRVESSIGNGLERNPTIEYMTKIISISYFDLPHDLRTCLLYLSIFPEDYVVGKEILIRRWIAEGFIRKKHGYTLYEAGEICFNELINRSLIQPDFDLQVFDEVTGCRVHDMVLDFIVSKSIEENFVTIIGLPGINLDPQNKVRRLSLQTNGEIPVGLDLSAVRSLNMFGRDVKIPSLSEFKHLRVLCFEDCWQVEEHHLEGIGNLLHLKCLRLNRVRIGKVPAEIAKLQYLETLDMNSSSTSLIKCASFPSTISLDRPLVHFLVTPCTTNPEEFEGIQSLEVMGSIFVSGSRDWTGFVRRLGDLTNLRMLDLRVSCREVERELACSIRKLVKANLRSLMISLCIYPNNLVEELNLPTECTLQELGIHGTISKVPRWIGSLVKLQKLSLGLSRSWQEEDVEIQKLSLGLSRNWQEEDVEILGGISNLHCLRVIYNGPAANPLKAVMENMIATHPNHPKLEWLEEEDMNHMRMALIRRSRFR